MSADGCCSPDKPEFELFGGGSKLAFLPLNAQKHRKSLKH